MTALILLLSLGLSEGVASSGPRVLLNEASVAELAALPGVSEDAAASIVSLRERRGRLSSVEALRVLHLPEETLASLRAGASIAVTPPPQKVDASTFSGPAEVLAQFSGEPTIRQVHTWANDYAKTSPRRVDRWLRQSVTFATLPQVQVEYRLRDDWDQGFDYLNAEGAELIPSEDPLPVIRDADQGQVQEVKVRLVWDLDKMVMSSERIRVINEAQDIVKLRDKVLTEVTRLYFERRRLQVERLLAPKADPLAQVREELRLLELTANIDALTGGLFSSTLDSSG